MTIFPTGTSVIFRESASGPPEVGTVSETFPRDADYPDGGLYFVRLDASGESIEAHHTELSAK